MLVYAERIIRLISLLLNQNKTFSSFKVKIRDKVYGHSARIDHRE